MAKPKPRDDPSESALGEDTMFTLALGIMIGLALGLIVVGFTAIGSYDRGVDAALRHRL